MRITKCIFALGLMMGLLSACSGTKPLGSKIEQTEVGEGWANNSINAVIFRRNSITTYKQTQFIAYYDPDSHLVLGKRNLGSDEWEINKTAYTGNTADAHNTISIAVDGEGFLHVSWDHHNNPLRYARSKYPLSLELGEMESMTGESEKDVTYPEFHNLPNGDLLFFYRSGESGRGNLVMNRYDVQSKKWRQLHDNLIDGEDARNAYWQAYVDTNGTIHLSWVWRETWDVSTNHDLAYAKSVDGGMTWQKSTGEQYDLPINLEKAEYAWKIPQNSSLINQTAIYADDNGSPFIASYWNENGKTQYQIIFKQGQDWERISPDFRASTFQLGGGGTKRIPISRPQVLVDNKGSSSRLYLLFRDEERGNKVSMALTESLEDIKWEIVDLTKDSVGQWEPSYDIELWKEKQQLHLFVQKVEQKDGEGLAEGITSPVKILEVK
ncbi:BNR repeat-containing protein [Echinicola marina]|uniref:BNR repeat-containing protein n=1 Tax=Echinicola marina TaxID=2859768 RepID=UPI001CF65E8C|nr:BNR repeat-containing protein [Echinicola marina]UCS93887.1 BNR repeat-containing protein [Echinicola marina]